MAEPLLKRFRSLLDETGLLPADSRVLVAVSGGADSVALLSLLRDVAASMRLRLVVAHLDHALRSDSADDACFVRTLAEAMGLAAVVERIDVSAFQEQEKGGPEEVARQVRRGFLERVAREQGCAFIALAHHRDDQAETFLLNLLRGAGSQGLSGMRMCAPPYIRPLLGFTRDELREYLAGQQLAWCEDRSNVDTRYTRNRVRHELLPLLESFNPRIGAHLAQLCERLAEDEDCWGQLIERELLEIGCETEAGISLPVELLRRLPVAFSSRLLRAALHKVRGDLRRITAAHIQAVLGLLEADRPQVEVHLPGAWAGRRYDRLWLAASAPQVESWTPVEIDGAGAFPLPDGRILNVICEVEPGGEDAETVEFPVAAIHWPLLIRTVWPGDALHPQGMTGRRKLQDLYVDLKLTREQRLRQPLIVSEKKILWVVGLRRCADFPVASAGCGKVVRMQIKSSEMLTKRL